MCSMEYPRYISINWWIIWMTHCSQQIIFDCDLFMHHFKTLFISFGIAIIVSIVAGGTNETSDDPSKWCLDHGVRNWHYYVFSQSWHPSVCEVTEDRACIPDRMKDHWVIHGLWPTLVLPEKGMYWPQCCSNNETLDMKMLHSLQDKLSLQWPELFIENPYLNGNGGLWNHEFYKHGSCSDMSQFSYFFMTLQFKNRIDLMSILKLHGIEPRNDAQIAVDKIANALKAELNVTPHLIIKDNSKKEKVLYEIWLCTTKNFLLIDCPYESSQQRADNEDKVWWRPLNKSKKSLE